MLQAIILDLNGVLIESPLLSDQMHDVYGVAPTVFLPALSRIMETARRPGLEDSFRLWRPFLRHWNLKLTKKKFFQFWFSGETVNRELLDYVTGLKSKGVKILLVSNNFKERTEYYKKSYPDLFKTITKAYFSCETGLVKPDVRVYREVLKENGLMGEECLYFDDSQRNLQAAAGLGIKCFPYEGLMKMKKIVRQFI